MSTVPPSSEETIQDSPRLRDSGPLDTTEGWFPLSLMQESLWVVEQMAPGNSAYNLAEAWHLHGNLNVSAMEKSLRALSNRHEALRTVLSVRRGKPVQVVLPAGAVRLETTELGELTTGELTRRVQREARRPFALLGEPLARFILFRLGECEHVFLVNLHHIISDEWSVGLFLREFAECYAACLRGSEPSLAELPIQYGDFAVWQRDLLENGAFDSQLNYWRRQLAGPLEPLTLPNDYPRPAIQSFRGATCLFSLPGNLVEKVNALGKRRGVTRFMTMLAAFQTLLHRYSRQDDIVIGSPMAGRDRVETEGIIGFFVNTHALRTNLGGDPSFIELLDRVREVVLGAFAHQEISVEKVVEALQPERDLSRHPLYDVVFGLQPGNPERWPLPGLEAKRLELDNGGAKFDLTVLLTETASGACLRCEYCEDLYAASTIKRLAQHFETLLQGIVEAPHRRLSEFRLLPEAERCRLLSAWNPAPVDSEESPCVHRRFEEQAARAPGAAAAVLDGESLNYGELNRKANQVARHLKQLGVAPEVPVALCLERSFPMLVAVLAVLKAGGYYVPVDPAYPPERIRFILEDTRAPVVLTVGKLQAVIPECGARIVCIDQESVPDDERCQNPDCAVLPSNTAYLIYTSGSTGKPKGVQVTHHNLARLFLQTDRWFGFGPSDVWTLFHSYTFDFSVWEMWGALAYGGRLVIVPYLVSRSPADFYDLLAREKVTVLNQTPSAFRQLIWAEQSAKAAHPLSLRYVICGGEALDLPGLKPWFERHGDEQPVVVNMYGITETSVHVTYRVIRAKDLAEGIGSVIGTPIPDLRLYLLDDSLQPVPTGVPGELCIGGAGVARGYLNRPELTEERFVPDPFSGKPAARLYRSGDLARFTSNGELEYLGRKDDQVKLRGFRVELGEIASALSQHPGLRDCAVLARGGENGTKRLVAYVVPVHQAPSGDELRTFLAQKLPDYMLPSEFVSLPVLPLTANGKLDRRALPAPETGRQERSGPNIPPETPLQNTIADIWRQVLNRDSISLHDHFFHLGGHSLLATQVIARLSAALDLDLSVRLLFEWPTVATLAEAVAQAQRDQPASAGAIPRRQSAVAARELLARLDQLTAAELDEFLAGGQGRALSA